MGLWCGGRNSKSPRSYRGDVMSLDQIKGKGKIKKQQQGPGHVKDTRKYSKEKRLDKNVGIDSKVVVVTGLSFSGGM